VLSEGGDEDGLDGVQAVVIGSPRRSGRVAARGDHDPHLASS
jgi:hypothetical protein